MARLNLEAVRHALQVARDNGFAELEIEVGSDSFSATLDQSPSKKKLVQNLQIEDGAPAPQVPVKSNSVGYFKSLPAFDTGKAVKQGQVIATISALGLSYDVESPATGTLVSVLASESQPVQYGQVLAYIENSTEDSEEI